MAQRKTCDVCSVASSESYASGWGHVIGHDPEEGHVSRDLCPRCTSILFIMLRELRARVTAGDGGAVATTATVATVASVRGEIERRR